MRFFLKAEPVQSIFYNDRHFPYLPKNWHLWSFLFLCCNLFRRIHFCKIKSEGNEREDTGRIGGSCCCTLILLHVVWIGKPKLVHVKSLFGAIDF